jgi:hypothetical protein
MVSVDNPTSIDILDRATRELGQVEITNTSLSVTPDTDWTTDAGKVRLADAGQLGDVARVDTPDSAIPTTTQGIVACAIEHNLGAVGFEVVPNALHMRHEGRAVVDSAGQGASLRRRIYSAVSPFYSVPAANRDIVQGIQPYSAMANTVRVRKVGMCSEEGCQFLINIKRSQGIPVTIFQIIGESNGHEDLQDGTYQFARDASDFSPYNVINTIRMGYLLPKAYIELELDAHLQVGDAIHVVFYRPGMGNLCTSLIEYETFPL